MELVSGAQPIFAAGGDIRGYGWNTRKGGEMRDDVIYVECVHCGGRLRWIPREIQDHIDKLEARIRELEGK